MGAVYHQSQMQHPVTPDYVQPGGTWANFNSKTPWAKAQWVYTPPAPPAQQQLAAQTGNAAASTPAAQATAAGAPVQNKKAGGGPTSPNTAQPGLVAAPQQNDKTLLG